MLELKERINQNLGHTHKEMVQVCFAIIEYVSIGPSKKPHLTFMDLYRVSPKVHEDVFYDAVFYLNRKNIKQRSY